MSCGYQHYHNEKKKSSDYSTVSSGNDLLKKPLAYFAHCSIKSVLMYSTNMRYATFSALNKKALQRIETLLRGFPGAHCFLWRTRLVLDAAAVQIT